MTSHQLYLAFSTIYCPAFCAGVVIAGAVETALRIICVEADISMAHLWIRDADGWAAKRLAAERFDLVSLKTCCGETGAGASAAATGETALLLRAEVAGMPMWALVAAPRSGFRVNGEEPVAGLQVLADRDELRAGDKGPYFFSTEMPAAVALFEGSGRPVFCGRCRQQIEPGSPAVHCPGCGVWYNQSPEFECWTYAETCAFCDTRTALDAGLRWTPEE
ncbi:MAG: hypothetical protein ACLQHF_07615 [Terracidiphilus sp.]